MTHSRSGFMCAVALLCAIGCALPQTAAATGIIVSRDPGLSAGERADIRSDAGVTLDRALPLPHVEVVTAPDDRAEQALATLNADPDVRFAVPDVPVHAAATPATDPLFDEQWAFDSGTGPDIDLPEAWDDPSSQGGAGVTVAVADQRININHPDLDGNIDHRYRADPGAFDFTEPDGCTAGSPLFSKDHGTHVAGTVAAERDNGIGIAGVAPAAKILPLRTLDNCGGGMLSWVLAAFAAAGDNDVPIVVASFATDPLMDPGKRVEYNELIGTVLAANPGTLYVVAAGNEGNDNDELPVYPCNTLLAGGAEPENLVCVGMTKRDDVPVCWGNVGQTSVDLFAPGVEIWSTVSPSAYAKLGGTSMAAPMVAGTAALLKSTVLPSYGASQLHDRLLRGVDTYEGMSTVSVSGGRLNAARVVTDVDPASPRVGGDWATCDRDHDTVLDAGDDCPDQPGTPALLGCRDADGDGLLDGDDNCPGSANADQADADGDRVGDVCDATPRGDDADGDAKAFLDDRCPYQASPAPDGCPQAVDPGDGQNPGATPTPTPTPDPGAATRIVSLDFKVTPRSCPKSDRKCAKTAKVTVKLSRQAKVAVKVEKWVKRKGRWVWRRVSSRSLTANTRGTSLTVRGKRGRPVSKYRVTATIAGTGKAVSFRV